MVEQSEVRNKPGNLQRAHDKIARLYNDNAKMEASESELDDLSRQLVKMPHRGERVSIEETISVLFHVAKGKMTDDADKEVLDNLRKHVMQVEQDLYRPKPRYMDAFFFPNKDNVHKLVRYIQMAKKCLRICVFNLTNNDLANAVKDVHRAGVKVQVITDDECMKNKGNDCQALADAGIPVRTDSEEQFHMHNKFMIVDDQFLLTGSFNWTFQASASNQENLLVVDHPFYLERYTKEFERLWGQFASNEVEKQEQAARTIQNHYRRNRGGGNGGNRNNRNRHQGW